MAMGHSYATIIFQSSILAFAFMLCICRPPGKTSRSNSEKYLTEEPCQNSSIDVELHKEKCNATNKNTEEPVQNENPAIFTISQKAVRRSPHSSEYYFEYDYDRSNYFEISEAEDSHSLSLEEHSSRDSKAPDLKDAENNSQSYNHHHHSVPKILLTDQYSDSDIIPAVTSHLDHLSSPELFKLYDQFCKKAAEEDDHVQLPNGDFHPKFEMVVGLGFYRFHTKARSWEKARRVCEAENAHLAVINSPEEAQALKEIHNRCPFILSTHFNDYQYLGVHDRHSEGHWETIFDTPLESTGYVNWARNQPDNAHELGENCLTMNRQGFFNDVPCWMELPFMCEHN